MTKTTEKIVLTLNRIFLNRLKQKAEKEGYSNHQQFIYQILRRNIYHKKGAGRPQRGRYAEEIRMLGRRRIFAKKGGKLVDV